MNCSLGYQNTIKASTQNRNAPGTGEGGRNINSHRKGRLFLSFFLFLLSLFSFHFFSFFRIECLPTSPLVSLLPSFLFLGFKVSLCNEGWPHICHPPASIFPELGLQMTAITSILISATNSIKTHPHESLGGTKYPTMTHIHAEFPRVKSGRFYTWW